MLWCVDRVNRVNHGPIRNLINKYVYYTYCVECFQVLLSESMVYIPIKTGVFGSHVTQEVPWKTVNFFGVKSVVPSSTLKITKS